MPLRGSFESGELSLFGRNLLERSSHDPAARLGDHSIILLELFRTKDRGQSDALLGKDGAQLR